MTLPATDALLRLAARVVWFKSAIEASQRPEQFVADASTYATQADVSVLRRYLSDDEWRAALDHAPPGIIGPAIMGLLEPAPRSIPATAAPAGAWTGSGSPRALRTQVRIR